MKNVLKAFGIIAIVAIISFFSQLAMLMIKAMILFLTEHGSIAQVVLSLNTNSMMEVMNFPEMVNLFKREHILQVKERYSSHQLIITELILLLRSLNQNGIQRMN